MWPFNVTGEEFLLYDSRYEDDEDDEEDEGIPRVMVFATRNNLRLLGKSPRRFLDGTFSVAYHLCLFNFLLFSGFIKRTLYPLWTLY